MSEQVRKMPPLAERGDGAETVMHPVTSPRHFSIWADPERQATLTKLWINEYTCAHIAKVMGLTRNQVIGRAHRTGLPRRQNPVAPPSLETIRKRAAKRKEYLREHCAGPRAKPVHKEQPAGLPDPPLAERILLIEEMLPDRCKYPCDGGGFCGRERWAESMAYCRTHHLKCHSNRKD